MLTSPRASRPPCRSSSHGLGWAFADDDGRAPAGWVPSPSQAGASTSRGQHDPSRRINGSVRSCAKPSAVGRPGKGVCVEPAKDLQNVHRRLMAIGEVMVVAALRDRASAGGRRPPRRGTRIRDSLPQVTGVVSEECRRCARKLRLGDEGMALHGHHQGEGIGRAGRRRSAARSDCAATHPARDKVSDLNASANTAPVRTLSYMSALALLAQRTMPDRARDANAQMAGCLASWQVP